MRIASNLRLHEDPGPLETLKNARFLILTAAHFPSEASEVLPKAEHHPVAEERALPTTLLPEIF